MLKFAENCSVDKVSIVCHLSITTILVSLWLALETGCFFLNTSTFLRAFAKSLHVIATCFIQVPVFQKNNRKIFSGLRSR